MRSINSDTKDVERIVDRLIHRQVIDEAQRDEWVKNLKSMSRNKRKVYKKLADARQYAHIDLDELIDTMKRK